MGFINRLGPLSLTFDLSGSTTASAASPVGRDGWVRFMKITMPAASANVSATLTFTHPDAKFLQVGATNALSHGSTVQVTGAQFPLAAADAIKLTWNAIPGSAAGVSATPSTATVELYLDTR
jgi:hypothetical protein